MEKKAILLRVLILIAILSAPAYFIYRDYQSSVKAPTTTADINTDNNIATSTIPVSTTKPIALPNGVTLANPGKVPNLDAKWNIPDRFTPDTKVIINKQITEFTTSLKADNSQFDKWISLGNLRKLIGDYVEAANIYSFVSLKWPDSLVAFHNLGDIYGFYLKDYVKAEQSMKKVILLDPHYTAEYISLHDLYLREYGERDSRVLSILITGLASNPRSVDLMINIALSYKNVGDMANAKKYYEMALAEAKLLGNSKLQSTLESELASF